MRDFENATTAALLVIQENLLHGLAIVAQHHEAGTFNVSAKVGAAPPSQSGNLTLSLLLGVEDELEARILGFKRSIDPQLFAKTL
jgi:hypothetical protein